MPLQFNVTLTDADWDSRLGGWKCDALALPSAHLAMLYHDSHPATNREFIVERLYIIWNNHAARPAEVIAEIDIQSDLADIESKKLQLEADKITLEREKSRAEQRWKAIAAAGAVLSALLSTAVTLFINGSSKTETMSKSFVQSNYVSNTEVHEKYTANAEVAARYTPNAVIQSNFTPNAEIANNYIARATVNSEYVPKTELAGSQRDIATLKQKLALFSAAPLVKWRHFTVRTKGQDVADRLSELGPLPKNVAVAFDSKNKVFHVWYAGGGTGTKYHYYFSSSNDLSTRQPPSNFFFNDRENVIPAGIGSIHNEPAALYFRVTTTR